MIKDLDLTLKDLITGEADPGGDLAQAKISFSVPDEEWRSAGSGQALNVYLYDIRENLELRTNERRVERDTGGSVIMTVPPPRVDCAYIITAWDKGVSSGGEDKELLEHRLLSQVLVILLNNPKIPANYLQGLLVGQEPDLPMVSAQKGGLPEPVEFWNALGSPLRPSINCVVTISLTPGKSVELPAVQSRVVLYEQQER